MFKPKNILNTFSNNKSTLNSDIIDNVFVFRFYTVNNDSDIIYKINKTFESNKNPKPTINFTKKVIIINLNDTFEYYNIEIKCSINKTDIIRNIISCFRSTYNNMGLDFNNLPEFIWITEKCIIYEYFHTLVIYTKTIIKNMTVINPYIKITENEHSYIYNNNYISSSEEKNNNWKNSIIYVIYQNDIKRKYNRNNEKHKTQQKKHHLQINASNEVKSNLSYDYGEIGLFPGDKSHFDFSSCYSLPKFSDTKSINSIQSNSSIRKSSNYAYSVSSYNTISSNQTSICSSQQYIKKKEKKIIIEKFLNNTDYKNKDDVILLNMKKKQSDDIKTCNTFKNYPSFKKERLSQIQTRELMIEQRQEILKKKPSKKEEDSLSLLSSNSSSITISINPLENYPSAKKRNNKILNDESLINNNNYTYPSSLSDANNQINVNNDDRTSLLSNNDDYEDDTFCGLFK